MSGKTYKSIPELVELMRSRGLDMAGDEDAVSQFLRGVNYYRFTGYTLPFLCTREKFKPGSKFSEVRAVYRFDRELRLLMSDALGVVELTFRTHFARELSRMLGAEAHLEKEAFRPGEYERAMKYLWADFEGSTERCAQHFKHSGENPPVWALVDVTTFGHLSRLFRALRNDYRAPIAKCYGYDSSKALCSLIQHLCVLRNRCAHHSRLYDLPWGQHDEPKDVERGSDEDNRRRFLYIFPELPEWTTLKQSGFPLPRFYSLFYQLALIYRFLLATPEEVFDHVGWKSRVAALLSEVPKVSAHGVDLKRLLGIPDDILASPVWSFGEKTKRIERPATCVGGQHTDARGTLRFCNDFDISEVRRFYTISNSREQPKRGWIGHKRETKWFFPLRGTTTILVDPFDDGRARIPDVPQPQRFVLSADEPAVLRVPPNNWFLIEQNGTAEVQVFSNCKVGEFPNDDFRKEIE